MKHETIRACSIWRALEVVGDVPVLLIMEKKAGHGVGKPIAKVIESWLNEWGFLFWQLGVEVE